MSVNWAYKVYRTHWHLSKISPEHTGDIVGIVMLILPVQIFAILDVRGLVATIRPYEVTHSWRCLKRRLELSHSLTRPAHSERSRKLSG